VAAVQAVVGAVDGDLEVGVSAGSEDDGLLAALVDGAVADEEDVAADEVAVGVQDLLEVGRAGLFFALPDEAEVGTERDFGGAESVERGELGEDGGSPLTSRSSGVKGGVTVQSAGVTGWPS
jgi:hypothetical protein